MIEHDFSQSLFFVFLCPRRLKSKNYQTNTQGSYLNIIPGKNKLRTVEYSMKFMRIGNVLTVRIHAECLVQDTQPFLVPSRTAIDFYMGFQDHFKQLLTQTVPNIRHFTL
jgi:hypothetical protein